MSAAKAGPAAPHSDGRLFADEPHTRTTGWHTLPGLHSLDDALALEESTHLAWRRIGVMIETTIMRVGRAHGEDMHTVRMQDVVDNVPIRCVVLPA